MKIKIILLLLSVIIPLSTLRPQVKRYQAEEQYSWITYKITHPLHEVEATSKSSLCLINADVKTKEIKQALVMVAVTSFNSENSNRDSHAMEVVNALTYPDAKFLSSSITQNGDSLKIYGKLTFHGVTKNVIIDAYSQWTQYNLTITGTFSISLTEFKIERPSLFMVPVNDKLTFTFKQFFNI